MTANIAFALSAAVVSLAIVVLAGIKGDWAVVAVYTLLVAGFLARAGFGRRARRELQERSADAAGEPEHGWDETSEPGHGPEHRPERELRGARFKRR